ncbi:helix-turn-helix domain-containing protein [Faecalibaculum rodentium]|uniref:helix-turn-helix domain-containing protein n=1 Tax=Faecalibaculum rodentium TaxID=1702221 RepID=UPI0023F37B5B|nr:helix-turn-helix transcriptional regulator [Faecalibaculum rodentium]
MLPLYENIKMLREREGLSQEELAKKAGYTSRASIAKIEKGLVDLPQSRIAKFAEIFGVSEAQLMGWTDISNEVDPQWGDDEANIEYLKDNPRLLDQYIELTRKNDTIGLLFDKVKDLSPKDVEKVLKIVELIDQENE